MRILILNCDFDKSSRTNGAALIKRHLDRLNGVKVSRIDLTKGKFPKKGEIAKYSGVIITGSRAGVRDKYKWVRKLPALLSEMDAAGTKCLGICFGFQMVAESFGGKVGRGKAFEEGFKRISVSGKAPPIFKSMPRGFYVYQSHWDIAKRLPKGATVISRNSESVQAFSLRKFQCVQFHPEILPETALAMCKRDKKDKNMIMSDVKANYKTTLKILYNFADYCRQ